MSQTLTQDDLNAIAAAVNALRADDPRVPSAGKLAIMTDAWAAFVPTLAPAGWWRVGETAGPLADSSGNGRALAMAGSGTTFAVAGAVFSSSNGAIQLNGSGSASSSNAALKLTGQLTVSAWVNTSNLGWQRVISFRDQYGDLRGWEMNLDPSGYPNLFMGNGTTFLNHTCSTPVADGKWHLVSVTFKSGVAYEIWVDGVNVDGAATAVTITAAPTAPVTVGAQMGQVSGFVGKIDEPMIFSRALTASEQQGLWAAGTGVASATAAYDPAWDINWVCIGDSHFGRVANFPSQLYANNVYRAGYTISTPGQDIATMNGTLAADLAARFNPLIRRNIFVTDEVTNSIYHGRTADQAYADALATIAIARGQGFEVLWLLPPSLMALGSTIEDAAAAFCKLMLKNQQSNRIVVHDTRRQLLLTQSTNTDMFTSSSDVHLVQGGYNVWLNDAAVTMRWMAQGCPARAEVLADELELTRKMLKMGLRADYSDPDALSEINDGVTGEYNAIEHSLQAVRSAVSGVDSKEDQELSEIGQVATPADVTAAMAAQLTGSGDVLVDERLDARLAFKDSHGAGIGGAVVAAYVKSEWEAGVWTKRGETTTRDDGGFKQPLKLAAGTYVITYKATGYQLATQEVTV